MKRCTLCGVEKLESEFPKCSKNKDGLYSWCRECSCRRSAARYAAKHDEINAGLRERRANDHGYRELCHARDRARYEREAERRKATAKRWREENPERFKAHIKAGKARRRAREKNAQGDIKHWEWTALLRFYGGYCLRCGSMENIHLDHVVPISVGGRNTIANVQPLCSGCNQSKHTKTVDYRFLPVLAVIPY